MNEGEDVLPKASLKEAVEKDPLWKGICALKLMRTMIDPSLRKVASSCILPQSTTALRRDEKRVLVPQHRKSICKEVIHTNQTMC